MPEADHLPLYHDCQTFGRSGRIDNVLSFLSASSAANGTDTEVAGHDNDIANYPQIRLFHVPKVPSTKPARDVV
ncbi:MAG: hypothetical protein O3A00_21815, partial [Planctomycetota bacterium]|nr:hypothetical protein [Planctomycetota bacterium]